MSRFFKITIIILLLVTISSCDQKTPCEKNGHTWIDATYEVPKTCSVCHITEGEPLIDYFSPLQQALEEIKQKNCTIDFTQESNLDVVSNYNLQYDGNNLMAKLLGDGYVVLYYSEKQDNKISTYESYDEGLTWQYAETVNENEFASALYFPVDYEFTKDMFNHNSLIYVGELKQINNLYHDFLNLINQTYSKAMSSSYNSEVTVDAEFTRYNVRLEENHIKGIYFTLKLKLKVSGITMQQSLECNQIYSNIGTTVVERPSNLPLLDEGTTDN